MKVLKFLGTQSCNLKLHRSDPDFLFRSRRDESSHSDHNNYGRRDRYDSQDYRQMDDQVNFTFQLAIKGSSGPSHFIF